MESDSRFQDSLSTAAIIGLVLNGGSSLEAGRQLILGERHLFIYLTRPGGRMERLGPRPINDLAAARH